MSREGSLGTRQSIGKIVVVLLVLAFLAIFLKGFLQDVPPALKSEFADYDGRHLRRAFVDFTGEGNAATRITLVNDYSSIEMNGNSIELNAPFLDSSVEIGAPPRFTYQVASLSGRELCVVKDAFTYTISKPPCDVPECGESQSVSKGDIAYVCHNGDWRRDTYPQGKARTIAKMGKLS